MINAVAQSSYKYAETSELIFLMMIHVYMHTTLSFFLGKHVIQRSPSKFDKRLFSDRHLCRYVWKKEEKYRILCFEAGSSGGTLQQRIG